MCIICNINSKKSPHFHETVNCILGDTLYTILHLKRDKFPMSKIKIIAEQIAQGMSYLHHRGIVHKDLKSKNIFFERGRAIITDFGLVNVARRLCARQKRVEQKSKTTGYERYLHRDN